MPSLSSAFVYALAAAEDHAIIVQQQVKDLMVRAADLQHASQNAPGVLSHPTATSEVITMIVMQGVQDLKVRQAH